MKSGNKVVELESLRGLAAVIVAVGHYFYGFLPAIHTAALGTPYFAFFNGGASVVFFFVLSGYVLSIGPLKTGNLGRIVISALKRWPRLAGPVLIVSAISGILSVSGLYFNEEAGRITGSGWLRSFNFAFEGGPSLSDALYEGAFSTFFAPGGSNQYNAVLWTMHYEFIGSMIVFALVAVLLVADGQTAQGWQVDRFFSDPARRRCARCAPQCNVHTVCSRGDTGPNPHQDRLPSYTPPLAPRCRDFRRRLLFLWVHLP